LRDGESEDGPYRGLNLSCRVLDALLKYPRVGDAEYGPDSQVPKLGAYYSESELLRKVRDATGHEPGEETQCPAAVLMDWADDITYAVHDVEDFFRAGVLPLWTLTPDSATLQEFLELHKRFYPKAAGQATAAVIADLINPATSPYAVPDDGSLPCSGGAQSGLLQPHRTLCRGHQHQ
jgi:dGTPase